MRKILVVGLTAFASLFVFSLAARAQGSIAGSVKDTSGAVMPGVTVEVASPALIEKIPHRRHRFAPATTASSTCRRAPTA